MIKRLKSLGTGVLLAAGMSTLYLFPEEGQGGFRCALIANPDSIVKFRTFENNCPDDPKGKPWRWLPAPETPRPDYAQQTHVLDPSTPNYTVGEDEVTQGWATPRAKTAQELDAEKVLVMNGINTAVFKVLCRLENHDRVSDGKAAWSEAQCLAGFKSLLP